MALPTFKLIPTATNAAAPFCLGHAFKPGDVPAGSSVTAPFSDFQCVPKNAWPDGSLKFAILSGLASVAGTTPLVTQLLVGAQIDNNIGALTTTALRNTGVVATTDCGGFGSVTWSGADWDNPFQTWVSGAKMSSWIYRKPVGSDPHLVAWLEVRFWSNGAVEVLPWIENGYILVPAPANKNATYSFTLGGTQRCSVAIDLKSHQRTPIINGTALSYWLGTAPGISIKHDTAYLQATELVPTYSASVTTAAGDTPVLPTTYTPLQQGGFNYDGDSMGGTGAQDPIGLLPLHDVLYLTSSADLYPTVIRNGFSAGRYCLHFRDETTNQPLKFSSYPTLNIDNGQGFGGTGGSTTGFYTPAVTGGTGPSWDPAHCPSTGYLAYLTSAWYYFMEEVQFQATTNYLGNGDNDSLREGSKGITKPCIDAWQTRSCAWQTRSLFQALSATPDGHPLQVEFANSVKSNIDHFYNRYVAQANNPFGFIQAGVSSYGGKTANVPPWQEDFVSGAFGMGLAMNMPIPSAYQTKLAAFFQWHSQSIVGRLGDPAGGSGFPYMNADMYVISLSAASDPNFVTGTGPWRANWAEVYSVRNATLAVSSSPTDWITTDPTLLAGEIFPGPKALWGNLQPAIAYAVRFNVPGAAAAYARMKGAANWPTLQTALNTSALWSVVPSGQTTSGGTVSGTPGPHAAFTNQPPRGAGRGVFGKRHTKGAPISDIPVGGTNAVSPLRAIIENTDDPAIELRIHYTNRPSGFQSDGLGGYASTVNAVPYQIYRGGEATPIGSATDTIATTGGGGTSPVVTGVSVTPQNSQIAGGGTINFDWVVSGTGAISQGATCTTDLGTIDATGQLVGPAATSANQTGHVTITSTQDPTKQGTATFTVLAAGTAPQLASRNVNIQFGPQPSANLSGLSVAFYDETKPHLATVARYQSGTQTTDAQGRMQFTVQSTLPVSGVGLIVVYGPNGLHYNGPCSVS